jgi:hypothetical protein
MKETDLKAINLQPSRGKVILLDMLFPASRSFLN